MVFHTLVWGKKRMKVISIMIPLLIRKRLSLADVFMLGKLIKKLAFPFFKS